MLKIILIYKNLKAKREKEMLIKKLIKCQKAYDLSDEYVEELIRKIESLKIK